MESIVQTVFDSLDASTVEVGNIVADYNAVDEKIKSGRYTIDAINKELYPQRDRLRAQIQDRAAAAADKARAIISQYREETAERNRLNPDELTDDIKLLQPGIILEQRDIEGMLKRNGENRTMTQIILRYAKQNGIELKGTHYNGGQAENDTADALSNIVDYYAKWLDKPNGREMLKKFFSNFEQ